MLSRIVFVVSLLVAAPALAQHSHSPYGGQESRAIKALSEQETADLLAGRGMGLAKAAELNSYPGPLHALELAEQLHLTPAQIAALQDQKRRMAQEAMALGREIVAAEQALDRMFAERTVDNAGLAAQTRVIAELQGRLRAVHLATHLETRASLSEAQVRRYDELRGYATAESAGHRHRH